MHDEQLERDHRREQANIEALSAYIRDGVPGAEVAEAHGSVRPLQIGKEDRHLLALTLEGALGGEDLLGEVFRSVGVRGGKAGLRSTAGRYRVCAFRAELRRR